MPFYEDKDDEELVHLIRYVHEITAIQEKTQVSLRELNHKYFQLSSYMGCDSIETLANLYKDNVVRHREMIV